LSVLNSKLKIKSLASKWQHIVDIAGFKSSKEGLEINFGNIKVSVLIPIVTLMET
jgi:hypothetical protein